MDSLALSPEEEAQLAQYHLDSGEKSGSLIGRAGQQLANAPSDIFTDLSRLAFNVGLKTNDQTKAAEFPQPYTIPPAKTVGESVVDIGAALGRALPLIMGGETAGEGAAEFMGATGAAAKIIGSATGFGVSGLTENPDQAVTQAALGGAFRAADFLPLKYKLPLATAIGLATGTQAYEGDPNVVKATGIGLTNALLPFLLKGKGDVELAKTRAETPIGGGPMPTADIGPTAPLIEIPKTIQPQFDLIPPSTISSKQAPIRPVATLQSDFLPDLMAQPAKQHYLGGAPFGSLVRDASVTADEITRAETQSRGSLLEKLSHAPSGSLIEQPTITEGEVARAMEGRKQATQPNLLAPASVPSNGQYIVGPALIDKEGNIIAQGKIGESHKTLFENGIAGDNFDQVLEAFSRDEQHVFVDNHGKQLNRTEAAQVANKAGQADGATSLHSQDLRDPQPAKPIAATQPIRPLEDTHTIGLDEEQGKQIANQLGLEFNGIQQGYKEAPGYLQFRDPQAKGTAIAAVKGDSLAAFRDHLNDTRKKFNAPPVELHSSFTPPTNYKQAVSFRGQVFTGADHETAIAKVAERFPDYKSTSRKTDPIVRGWITPKGEFKGLMDIARERMPKENPVATLQPGKVHEIPNELMVEAKAAAKPAPSIISEPTPGSRQSMQKFGSNIDRVRALDAVKAGNKPVTIMSGPSNDFVKEAKDRGLKIARFKTEQGITVTVAHDANPQAVEAIKNAYHSKLPNAERDVLMGKALGFTDKEIAEFGAGRQVAAEPKVATSEVKGNTIKIGDSSYKITKRANGTWYYEDEPLSKSKQGAVQQIKQLHAASVSPSPSLEVAEEKLAMAAEGKFVSGDKVLVDFDGEWEGGTIVTPGEQGIHQVKLPDGSIVDIRESNIKPIAESGKFVTSRESEIKQIGMLEDFRKLEKDNAAKRSGMKLRQSLPEVGAIPIDVAVAISRYVAAPVVGAMIGAATSDQDHRLSAALKGAIAGGLVGVFGPKLFRLLAEGHVEVGNPASYPAAVKRTVEAAEKFAKSPAEGMIRASTTGHASNFDKIALWMSEHFTTNLAATRLIGKARGEVEVLGGGLHKALQVLSRAKSEGLSKNVSKLMSDYFEGKITHAVFEKQLGNPLLSQAAAVASQSRTALQKIVTQGLKEGELKAAITKSFDKYLTTSYKIFHDPKYFPTEEQIAKVAAELKDDHSSLETRIRIVTQDLRELKSSRAMFGGGRSGESLSNVLLSKKDISAAYADALGIYTDPIDRIIATTGKLIPVARSAEFFNLVADGVREDGLKYIYSEFEYGNKLDNLRTRSAQAALNHDHEAVATLQSQIENLNSYIWNPFNEAHGRLSGGFIDRRMHTGLSQRDALIDESNSFVARHLRNATTLFKYNKTVLSPLQFAKQILNVPLLGAMSRTGPKDWIEALQSLRNPEVRNRLTRLGVAGGDMVGGMLSQDLDSLLKGNLEKLSFNNPVGQAFHKWSELWRTPDLVVRVSAFQRQEAKMLAMIPDSLTGEARSLAVQKAEDAAIDFTNRYTMNYEVIPPGIRLLSNVPFVNQFLTWAFEITRVTKNVAEDAIKNKDPYAMSVLAGLAAAPFALQKASEAMLSEKDKADWEKTKALLPDYSRNNFVWVTHRDEKGHFHYINFTGLVIHDNYLKMFRDVMAGDKGAFMADNPIFGWENTPLLNIATNQISGQDVHTGEKLRTFGDRVDSIRRDFAPTLLGTDFDKFVQAMTPNADGSLGITDSRTGQSTTLSSLLLSYVTAVRGYTTDLNNLQKRAIFAAQADINDQRSELSRLLRTNARPDVKQRAVDQFRFTQKQIMMELGKQVQSN